jgi:predicted ATP-grasp superfamily ATP-dependent carboligase
MNYNNTNVLIGPANAISAPEVVWSLIQCKLNVYIYSYRGSISIFKLIKGVTILKVESPKVDRKKFLADIINIVENEKISVFIPLDDFAIESTVELSQSCHSLKIPVDHRNYNICLNKWYQIQAATSSGLLVPETRYCESIDEVLNNKVYPCFVKSSMAVALKDNKLFRDSCYVCKDIKELKKIVYAWDFARPMLIQPCLSGCGEGIFGFATGKKINWWSAHRRIRMMNPQGSGSSACEAIVPDGELLEPIKKFLAMNCWQGMFMIEFLRGADGKAYFMEMNGRAWGSMALARRGGFEYPAWTVLNLLDPEFEPVAPLPKLPLRCRHLGREIIHLLMVIRGPSSEAVPNWPSVRMTVRELLSHSKFDYWYNYHKNFLFFFFDTIMTVFYSIYNRKK